MTLNVNAPKQLTENIDKNQYFIIIFTLQTDKLKLK